MNRVLLDTDVVLDFFLDRKPFAENTAVILSLCENKKINGFLTPVIIANLYYLLRKVSTHKRVIEKLKQLMNIVDVLSIDRQVIMMALNSNFKDFEDALQNYASELKNGIDVIITGNVKDFQNSAIGILSPNEYLKINNL